MKNDEYLTNLVTLNFAVSVPLRGNGYEKLNKKQQSSRLLLL